MANTYEKIASVTVGSGGAAEIEFTNIPATFDDLSVFVSVRQETSNSWVLNTQFNGSSSSIYSQRLLEGDGSTAASYNASSQTSFSMAVVNASNSTSNTFGNTQFYIPNYAGSTNKSVSMDSAADNNATLGFLRLGAGLWASTAAITSIKFFITGGSDNNQHSTATLYGIKKS